jgi:hypothetical protein
MHMQLQFCCKFKTVKLLDFCKSQKVLKITETFFQRQEIYQNHKTLIKQ